MVSSKDVHVLKNIPEDLVMRKAREIDVCVRAAFKTTGYNCTEKRWMPSSRSIWLLSSRIVRGIL